MNKFIKVLNDVHEFIVGGTEKQPVKKVIGFEAKEIKPKRKYTRRKKKKWSQLNTLVLRGADLVNNSNL